MIDFIIKFMSKPEFIFLISKKISIYYFLLLILKIFTNCSIATFTRERTEIEIRKSRLIKYFGIISGFIDSGNIILYTILSVYCHVSY